MNIFNNMKIFIILTAIFLIYITYKDSFKSYKVIHIVDGDTIVIDYKGKHEKVRFIGVDCPESVHMDPSKNNKWGETSSKFTKKLLQNKKVTLEFDKEKRDKYGRLLAYVYINKKMVNELLLEKGYAVPMFIKPNYKYKENFKEIHKKALKSKKGNFADKKYLKMIGIK